MFMHDMYEYSVMWCGEAGTARRHGDSRWKCGDEADKDGLPGNDGNINKATTKDGGEMLCQQFNSFV